MSERQSESWLGGCGWGVGGERVVASLPLPQTQRPSRSPTQESLLCMRNLNYACIMGIAHKMVFLRLTECNVRPMHWPGPSRAGHSLSSAHGSKGLFRVIPQTFFSKRRWNSKHPALAKCPRVPLRGSRADPKPQASASGHLGVHPMQSANSTERLLPF